MAGGWVEPEPVIQAGDPQHPAYRAGQRDGQAEFGVTGGGPALDGEQAAQGGAVAVGGDGEVGRLRWLMTAEAISDGRDKHPARSG